MVQRVPKDYARLWLDSKKWSTTLKHRVSGKATVLEGLKLSAGYEMTGNASHQTVERLGC